MLVTVVNIHTDIQLSQQNEGKDSPNPLILYTVKKHVTLDSKLLTQPSTQLVKAHKGLVHFNEGLTVTMAATSSHLDHPQQKINQIPTRI